MSYIRLEQRQDQMAWCDFTSRILVASLEEDKCLCCQSVLLSETARALWVLVLA